ncbi:response regulator transcription factor [Maribacter sp. 2307UL18-2]|uniref:response regulator n=1 Tax=Maribacter sp. 2307UL18-2 TaxID=3386274 RepID=UPI0039BCD981
MGDSRDFNELIRFPKTINLLIVDDHPMTIWGYELTLKMYAENYQWNIGKATDCDQALNLLKRNSIISYDLVLLDINFRKSDNTFVKNGEELGKKIREIYPQIKIIVLTMLNDYLRIQGILKNLNPDGFIIKSEITPELLFNSIIEVLNNNQSFSYEIKKILSMLTPNVEDLSAIDRKILYYISIGEKMKNLPKHLPLSMASIERRKKNIKNFFGISEGSNRELIQIAKAKGYL